MTRYSTVAIRETGERGLFHGIDKQGRAVVRLLGVPAKVAYRYPWPSEIVRCLTGETLKRKRKILERT